VFAVMKLKFGFVNVRNRGLAKKCSDCWVRPQRSVA